MLRSDRVYGLRKERNLTQEELGQALGLTGKQISRYETEETNPSSEVVVKMARFFAVSADYLLGLSDHRTIYFDKNGLSVQEVRVIQALRNDDKLGAVKAIVNEG
jgi:transcriptional regulator with XRE-family HTH domain